MFSKKNVLWKPKNPHSLDYLKYLLSVLAKNQKVDENNKSILVETFRLITEILIWGDQNDSSIIDFFLEKNILAYFLSYIRQRNGIIICVQLLQTLNILFENITDKTSLYYLLSNNHINSIICHKFDFSDEEIMAYYISFLKTLSLKLNRHTINFFYNEHTNDFALYIEALKFFNHSEAMVRIAVRTITLNVFKVEDSAMLRYIREKTAQPYFRNLTWYIGNHCLDMDLYVRNDVDLKNKSRLDDMIGECLDHLHYVNDILSLDVLPLSAILTENFVHRLVIPLFVYSLTRHPLRNSAATAAASSLSSLADGGRKNLQLGLALYLLSQIFQVIRDNSALIGQIAQIVLEGDLSVCMMMPPALSSTSSSPSSSSRTAADSIYLSKVPSAVSAAPPSSSAAATEPDDLFQIVEAMEARERQQQEERRGQPGFVEPEMSLIDALESTAGKPRPIPPKRGADVTSPPASPASIAMETTTSADATSDTSSLQQHDQQHEKIHNITDEEKLLHRLNIQQQEGEMTTATRAAEEGGGESGAAVPPSFSLQGRPYLRTIFRILEVASGASHSMEDHDALLASCLLSSLLDNPHVPTPLLQRAFLLPPPNETCAATSASSHAGYNRLLVERLILILAAACKPNSKIRLVTVELICTLLKKLLLSAAAPTCASISASSPPTLPAASLLPSVPRIEQPLSTLPPPPPPQRCIISDAHLALILEAKEEITLLLRNYFKSEEIFVDMFEDEHCSLVKWPLRMTALLNDSSILLPPSATPMSGLPFLHRLPCGDVEKARYSIRVFLLIRRLCRDLHIAQPPPRIPPNSAAAAAGGGAAGGIIFDSDTVLPKIQIGDKLDLNNSDLIACTVEQRAAAVTSSPSSAFSAPGGVAFGSSPSGGSPATLRGQIGGGTPARASSRQKRFLVIDFDKIILVEPDSKQLGWGVVTFVGDLQHIETQNDREDSRCLHITVRRHGHNQQSAHRTAAGGGGATPMTSPSRSAYTHPHGISAAGGGAGGGGDVLLAAKFLFDDHIRCMAANHRLNKGREQTRQKKLQQVALLLDFPADVTHTMKSVYSPGGGAAPSAYSVTSSTSQLRADRRVAHPPHSTHSSQSLQQVHRQQHQEEEEFSVTPVMHSSSQPHSSSTTTTTSSSSDFVVTASSSSTAGGASQDIHMFTIKPAKRRSASPTRNSGTTGERGGVMASNSRDAQTAVVKAGEAAGDPTTSPSQQEHSLSTSNVGSDSAAFDESDSTL